MIDGLCQGYHWSFEQAIHLTLPQIIMLNHAAWYNQKMGELRYEAKKKKEDDDPRGVAGMSSDQFASYWGSGAGEDLWGGVNYVETESPEGSLQSDTPRQDPEL